jgi:competence protein ComEC
MGVTYLATRALDHRSARWHSLALAASASVLHDPLDVLDAGFALTFLATGALLVVGSYAEQLAAFTAPVRWLLASLAASLATELALLPVAAAVFGRITFAGLLLNLLAIPTMALVQCAGIVACLGLGDTIGGAAGWLAHAGAATLVASSTLVDVVPWVVLSVPPPSALAVAAYVGAGVGVLALRGWWRGASGAALAVALVVLVSGAPFPAQAAATGLLRLVMFDVGQGEAMALFWPDGTTTLVDAGGVPFGSGAFDIGARVLRPSLLANGVRRLDDLLVTHGDPDHIGGAVALARAFRPRMLLEGIDVPGHQPSAAVREATARGAGRVRHVLAGEQWTRGAASIRVLNPPPPTWERRRVRNDDSVVLEVRMGEVALLLTGDIGADVERAIIPRLSPAPIRILKVAHHGSRTSTSGALLAEWRPQYAIVSAGRGNRFGHPAPDVIARLERAGARVYRTDRQGALTIDTDGRTVTITTYAP